MEGNFIDDFNYVFNVDVWVSFDFGCFKGCYLGYFSFVGYCEDCWFVGYLNLGDFFLYFDGFICYVFV